MNILVDMNLSPAWVKTLQQCGHTAVHWSAVGDHAAADTELLCWAKTHGYIVFTHDLDFGTILAATGADFPSVIQLRIQDVTPRHAGALVCTALQRFVLQLGMGCLISLDEQRMRARLLPLRKPS